MARKRDPLSQEELLRFERSVGEIFDRLGMNLSSPGCRDTPRQWLRALIDMTEGYDGDEKIRTVFSRECVGCESGVGEQTVEGPIEFISLCEHHALPFIGKVWIGYLRNETIIGVSKFTRIVHVYARRFSLQERMAQEIANELESILKPYGVIVYIQAHHTCTQARGVREATTLTRMLERRGEYQREPHLVSEFMDLAGLRRPLE